MAKIFIIEDMPHIMEGVANGLISAGHNVIGRAEDAYEALKLLGSFNSINRPDLIITDNEYRSYCPDGAPELFKQIINVIDIKGSRGLKPGAVLSDMIKNDNIFPELKYTPIILMSSVNPRSIGGADEFIQKPYDPLELVNKILDVMKDMNLHPPVSEKKFTDEIKPAGKPEKRDPLKPDGTGNIKS